MRIRRTCSYSGERQALVGGKKTPSAPTSTDTVVVPDFTLPVVRRDLEHYLPIGQYIASLPELKLGKVFKNDCN